MVKVWGYISIIVVISLFMFNIDQATSLAIDGDMSDWIGIDPIIVDEAVNESYFLDVGAVFMNANDTHLVFRMDYDVTIDYWESLMANITIRTPNQTVFVLLCQIVYEQLPHWSFTGIFRGIDILSMYNNFSMVQHDIFYENTVAIDLTTNSSIEFCYMLTDLGLKINDSIDITVWHYDGIIVGEYFYQGIPIIANTQYGVQIQKKLATYPESTSGSTTNPTSSDDTADYTVSTSIEILPDDTTTAITPAFGILSSVIITVLITFQRRKYKI